MTDHLLDVLSRYIARVRSTRGPGYGILPGATADRVLLGTSHAGGANLHGTGTINSLSCQDHAVGPARRDTVITRSTPCDGRMIRLSHDARNCGRVGVECDPGEICLAGVCRPGRTRF